MSDITKEQAIEELKEYVAGLDLEYATPFDKAILFAINSLDSENKIREIKDLYMVWQNGAPEKECMFRIGEVLDRE